ncbi:hypothetical protein Cgig2_020321 [Carnegiea gigantea]|uniref:Uncharacterized protein n=1 Tax=Carnegiea gigantea TaxID=171969 RepID=A0A9Q1JUB7_9CARY|nr:hypothetical protein Cgig2_020321 [Carnegiea gigantea]
MGLPEEDSKFLLSTRSAVLPVRVGAELLLEPYYPNQFARQFGFDQGGPSNHLSFFRALRQQRSIIDLALAHADVQSCAKEKPLVSSSEKGKTKLSIIEICWLSSKIEEIFGVVKTAVKIEELVDVDRVKALSDQDVTCSSEIAHIKDQLNNLSSKASKLKVKEQEVLREEKRIRKMEAEEVKADLTKAGFSKLQDLEKEKNHLKSLIGSIISFNNV